MTRAAAFMPDSQKVEKMRLRLQTIVQGFEDKVVTVDDFDKTYYHPEKTHSRAQSFSELGKEDEFDW